MRIILVTDAWEPQVNGVVRTLKRTVEECRRMGHEVEVISPYDGYLTLPLPTYPEIKLAIFAKRDMRQRIERFEPDAIHIATEGTIGLTARALCLKWNWPFTTSYHTQFPEYIHARLPIIPLSLGYAFMRWFHNSGGRMMVTTPSMREVLFTKGFRNISDWARGVDTKLFNPDLRDVKNGVYAGLARPVFVNVGRIAVEKNIETFLKLDLPGTKVVVGDGPQLNELKQKYPEIIFTGAKYEQELARHFADADVFVFPSITDTFGLVNLEAMACGTPVASFPVPGPQDIIGTSGAGVFDKNLCAASLACLKLDRKDARKRAQSYSWEACAEDFVKNLEVPPQPERRRFWKRLRRLGGRVRPRLPKRLRRSSRETEQHTRDDQKGQ
jgi:1,2-diacylglycerol 3-alpha-glucosyltransferase/glucuronosyltransferase